MSGRTEQQQEMHATKWAWIWGVVVFLAGAAFGVLGAMVTLAASIAVGYYVYSVLKP